MNSRATNARNKHLLNPASMKIPQPFSGQETRTTATVKKKERSCTAGSDKYRIVSACTRADGDYIAQPEGYGGTRAADRGKSTPRATAYRAIFVRARFFFLFLKSSLLVIGRI